MKSTLPSIKIPARPLVVKLGGEVIAGKALSVVAADIATLNATVAPCVVVHGGGPQATQLQEALGQKPVIIAGRRVTDADTLEVMKMVVAGKLNMDVCSALLTRGALPIGLHGASARVIRAEKRPPKVYPAAGPDPVDLGYVGDVTGINLSLMELLLQRAFIPVLACLGAGADGQVYNINADIVANRVAAELNAAGVFLISDVPGVLRDASDPHSRIATLSVSEGKQLIASGAVTKGMIVKLEESFEALLRGIPRIHIVGKLHPGDLVKEAQVPGSVGTALVP